MTHSDGRRGPRRKTPNALGEVVHVRYGRGVTDRICEQLARGKPWYRICNLAGMPSYSAFYAWKRKHPEFAQAVEAAQEAGADYCADFALEVAAGATKETVQQDRLHVSTLLKRAALSAPRRWGGKGEHGGKAAKPEPVEIVFRVRHFERVVGPDGKAFVREIKPKGEA